MEFHYIATIFRVVGIAIIIVLSPQFLDFLNYTAMAAAEEVQFSLKVTMIKESCKVLYVEVDNDFADVLLSFLTLPLGTIVRLLIKHYGNDAPILGSLNSLYAGLQNMDGSHFWTEAGKLMLLNPRNSSGIQCSRLKLQIDDTPTIQYFRCPHGTCVSTYYEMRCFCGVSTNTDITTEVLRIRAQSGDKSAFTQRTSFILTDDLEIMINSPASIFRILKLSGIQDTKVLEERTMIFRLKEFMKLLKASLVSKTPLTYFVNASTSAAVTLDERKMFLALPTHESDSLPRSQTTQNISSEYKNFTIKVFVQKSTNRLLLAQTRHDFIDFLFSFLILPLGRVQFLLGNNTCFGSICNLYSSISSLEIKEYMNSRETITTLLEPQIPPCYLSSNLIFSLNQQTTPPLRSIITRHMIIVSVNQDSNSSDLRIIDPKCDGSFVRGPIPYVVTDNLAVSAAGSTSIVSILNRMNILLSDIGEQDLVIGVEEALSILRASLTSTSALTDGLKPFFNRQPKQEK